ncbi:MAG: ABC transporter ATP-binding protein [Chlamydiota bacterium]
MSVVLQAKDIYQTFYSPIKIDLLKGINLTISSNETIAIMGASGEGKSSLLHILGTLAKPSSGSLKICGQKATSTIRNQHVGFIFQAFHLLEDYSALDNILMPAKIARQATGRESKAYQRALSLLGMVGLEHRADHHTKLLSGGERQRVAIARALCNDPDIIMADEPTGNLDHQTSQAIHDLLINCAKQAGKALLIVTHDESLAALCDKTFLLEGGKLRLL